MCVYWPGYYYGRNYGSSKNTTKTQLIWKLQGGRGQTCVMSSHKVRIHLYMSDAPLFVFFFVKILLSLHVLCHMETFLSVCFFWLFCFCNRGFEIRSWRSRGRKRGGYLKGPRKRERGCLFELEKTRDLRENNRSEGAVFLVLFCKQIHICGKLQNLDGAVAYL